MLVMMWVILLHPSTKCEIYWSPLPMIWHIFHLSINQPSDLDLLTSNGVTGHLSRASFLPMFSFFALPFLT